MLSPCFVVDVDSVSCWLKSARTKNVRFDLFSHLASTGSLVALLFAVNMRSCLALDCTDGYPVALLWELFLLILFLLSLCCHLDSPC